MLKVISKIVVVLFFIISMIVTAQFGNSNPLQNPVQQSSMIIDDNSFNLPVIGTVKPRHARDIQASNWSVGAETMDRGYTDYEQWKKHLGPLGVKKARLQAGWARTEQHRGIYEFQWLDNIVYDMVGQGVEPWICLCYANPVYSSGSVVLDSAIPTTPEALQGWDRWVRRTVSRYKHVVDEWEIWNEPDNDRNTPEGYGRFLVRTARIVREIQPDAKILGMAMKGRMDTTWTARVLETVASLHGLALIDQVTFHPYAHNPDTVYPKVAALQQVIKRYAPHIQVRQGENGCPSNRRRTKALRNYDWTENSQAKWALRRLLGDLGRDIESSYFSIMDMKYPDEMNTKGLLKANNDLTVAYAKPAYFAVQALTAIFDHSLKRIPDCTVTLSTTESVSVFAYEHRKKDALVVAWWLDGDIPSDDNNIQHVNLIVEDSRLSDPVLVDVRQAQIYDIPANNVNFGDSVIRFSNMPMYDSPLLLAERSLVPMIPEF